MPLATNPKALFEIVLESDKKLPKNERPVFIYHYLTGLQQMEMADIMELPKTLSGSDFIKANFEAATMGLVSWRNIFDKNKKPISCDGKKLSEIMGIGEAMELAQKVFAKQFPSLEDKKKSDGQSESSSVKSAKTAKARKNAPTG